MTRCPPLQDCIEIGKDLDSRVRKLARARIKSWANWHSTHKCGPGCEAPWLDVLDYVQKYVPGVADFVTWVIEMDNEMGITDKLDSACEAELVKRGYRVDGCDVFKA